LDLISNNNRRKDGLNINGNSGIYAKSFDEDPKYEGRYRGNNSMFYFQNKIVCLGSNIENDDDRYKTYTKLFQSSLEKKEEPIWISGGCREDFDFNESLYVKSYLSILDNKSNGYYIPPGHRVSISKCTKDVNNNGEITSEDYASAYIDHGFLPKYEGYEYAVLKETTLKEIKDFCCNMIFEETSLYTVLQCDKYAHIVKDKESNITGYAVFNSSRVIDKGIVKAVDSPVMIMVKENGEELELNISLRNWIISKAVVLTLRGCWGLKEEGENCKIIAVDEEETKIQFICHQGKSIGINLVKAENIGVI